VDAFGDAGRADAHIVNSPAAPQALRSARRRRLWEISAKHHCVLLGAAFDARELRHMFRRGGYADWQTASDYELHSSAVCFAKSRNDFSALAQRALEDRFRNAVARFAAARTPDDLLRLWQACTAEGEAVAAYWAALSHSECDAELDERLSREMHMVAHDEFAARRAMLRRVRTLEERIGELIAKHATVQESADKLRQENRTLADAVHMAQASAREARSELARWQSGDMASAMTARQGELEAALEVAQSEAAAARRALRGAEQRLARLEAPSRPAEEREQRRAVPDTRSKSEPTPPPAPPNLDGRRVLCIGGKTSLMPQYRAVIEGARGDFAYHDGGIEHRVGRLSAMLAAADAVVCLAADCSHAAYRLAKRYCKAKGKPCALIANSSVTALVRCIGELGFIPA
jgi:hypothetical protein